VQAVMQAVVRAGVLSRARLAPAHLLLVLLLLVLLLLAGCSRSHFETPELQGDAAMVAHGGTQRLWVLTKQEEERQVGVGGGGTRNSTSWRLDTFFHFDVQAFDPVAAKVLWKQRLLTLGDPDAAGTGPSLVIGSDVDARLLGQDGDLVWLLIGNAPFALHAHDGSIAVDAEALQRINPSLAGLLPSEAKYYGFDRGLVLMAADARQLVIRGSGHLAQPYSPPPPPAAPQGPLMSNGVRELAPLLPLGDVPARHVTLDGQWLGLYTEKEAANAGDDPWGRNLRWPYNVLNEVKPTRRTFWRAQVITARNFDERYERLSELTPIAGAPTFLNGRFAKQQGSLDARVLANPEGVLVWHSTRIDDAGRLALARLDARLATVWRSELPLSEPGTFNLFATWWLPAHLVVVGNQQYEQDGATRQAPTLVSIDLARGGVQSVRLDQ
jgi:hypothetical protein